MTTTRHWQHWPDDRTKHPYPRARGHPRAPSGRVVRTWGLPVLAYSAAVSAAAAGLVVAVWAAARDAAPPEQPIPALGWPLCAATARAITTATLTPLIGPTGIRSIFWGVLAVFIALLALTARLATPAVTCRLPGLTPPRLTGHVPPRPESPRDPVVVPIFRHHLPGTQTPVAPAGPFGLPADAQGPLPAANHPDSPISQEGSSTHNTRSRALPETAGTAHHTATRPLPRPVVVALGEYAGHDVLIDLCSHHGLGLTGPGADAAARHIITTLTAPTQVRSGVDQPATIVLCAADTARLVPAIKSDNLTDAGRSGPSPTRAAAAYSGPPARRLAQDAADTADAAEPGQRIHDQADQARVYRAPTLGVALTYLEQELLTRARDHHTPTAEDPAASAAGPLVLFAQPTPTEAPRLHAILTHAGRHRTAAVLTGPWPTGTTLTLELDGTVAHTHAAHTTLPPIGRVFTATPADLTAVLTPPAPTVTTTAATPEAPAPRHQQSTTSPTDPDRRQDPADPPAAAATNGSANSAARTLHDGPPSQSTRPPAGVQAPTPSRPGAQSASSTPEPTNLASAATDPHTADPTATTNAGAHTPRAHTHRSTDPARAHANPPPDDPDGIERPCTESTAGISRIGGIGLTAAQPPATPFDLVNTEAVLLVNCFGELAVRVRARPLSPHRPTGDEADREITAQLTRQDARLLACLAVHPQGITTASLADILWPGSTHRSSGQRLRTALAHLRTVLREATDLPDASFATHRGGRYHLGAHSSDPHIWVDYTTFDQAVHTARTHTGQLRIDAWHRVAALYSGTLLSGIDLDWPELSTRQHSARRSATTALANLAQHYEHADPAQAIDLLRTLLTHDPDAERPAELLITLYVRGGNPRAADRAYARLAQQLAVAGRRPPASLTEALHPRHP